MSAGVDRTGWVHIGKSSNADFYEVRPDVLAVVPFEGCTDDAGTAQESISIQLEHLRSNGRKAGVVVFVDPVAEQSAEARVVYRDAPDPNFQACFALVGGTPFGRAVGSLFLGLSRPRVPTKLFARFEDAIHWIDQHLGNP